MNQRGKWAALALAALLLPATAQAGEALRFSIDGVAIKGNGPDGYCLPKGPDAAAAELLASGDKDNATHATLIPCAKMGSPDGVKYDYYLIKSPRAMAAMNVPRAQFLAMMKTELALPTYSDGSHTDSVIDRSSKDLTDTFGTRVDLSGEIAPRGADATCVYLGGQLNVATAGTSYPIKLAGCGTSVGGKILFVYAYEDPKTPNVDRVLIQRIRALASALQAADGRAN